MSGGGRIFLTGATGFVGAQVARQLLAAGSEVHALLPPGVDTWRIAELDDLHYLEGDLTAPESWVAALEALRPEVCVHLAWYAEHGKYWTGIENLDLLAASLRLVRRLAELGCRRFVGVGTCVEYDTRQGTLSEESTLRPESLYAASKLALSTVLEQVGPVTGMETAWLRLFYLYGPMEDPRRLVPYVITSLLAGQVVQTTPGQQARDYLHVADVASAICLAARSDLSGPVNVGSGVPLKVADLVTRIGQLVGREELIQLGARPMPEGEPPVIVADNGKLRAAGWSPDYTLDEGLRQTIAWWESQPQP